MGAHPLVAPIPVDPGDDAGADGRQVRALGGRMQDRLSIGVVDRVDDRDRPAVSERQGALISRLAAALRIEDGSVERDSAAIGEQDIGLRLDQIGVVPEQSFGHQTKTCGAVGLASSQAGTMRFLERRNAGLKSFEA